MHINILDLLICYKYFVYIQKALFIGRLMGENVRITKESEAGANNIEIRTRDSVGHGIYF